MFHAIVRRQYRKAWQAMNAHDYEAILAQLAPEFRITFVGDTTLGGTRTTVPSQRMWFQRLFRLFPDARFEMTSVAVDGPLWNTRVAGSFVIRATVAGRPYTNVFVQLVTLRWGKITSYTVYEDSLRFWHACRDLVAAGIVEAEAPAIAS
ncbi:MAG: SnoaL-like domain-containing protein [Catenulispora sp.]|nr:SnoaL-like domain-containing protein [Catenulispora sp.]